MSIQNTARRPLKSRPAIVILRATCLLLAALITTLSAASADDRLPVPPPAKQKELRNLIRNDVFKQDFAAAKTQAKQQELAQTLLEKAAGSADDRAGQFVLLEEARDMAAAGADVALVVRACDQLAAAFRVDAAQMKLKSLAAMVKGRLAPSQARALAGAALLVIGEAIAADDFPTAQASAELAQTAARAGGERELVKQVAERLQEVKDDAAAFEKLKKAREALAASPNDPEANLAVGKYKCFIKDDWAGGIKNLLKSADGPLKSAAEKEQIAASSDAAKARAGDAWWDIAAGEPPDARARIQAHAVTLYEQALPALTGLNKEKVERRLGDSAKLPAGAVLCFGFEKDDYVRKGAQVFVKDRSGSGNNGEIISAMPLAQGKVGSALVFDGKQSQIAVAPSESLNWKQFTISMWVNFRANPDGGVGGGQVLIHKKDAVRYWIDTFGWLRLEYKSGQGWRGINENGGEQWKPRGGQWIHLVAVYDGAKVHLYADDKEISVTRDIPDAPDASAEPMIFGQKDWVFSNNLNGAIDEVAIFNRALSEAEIARLYRMGQRQKSVTAR